MDLKSALSNPLQWKARVEISHSKKCYSIAEQLCRVRSIIATGQLHERKSQKVWVAVGGLGLDHMQAGRGCLASPQALQGHSSDARERATLTSSLLAPSMAPVTHSSRTSLGLRWCRRSQQSCPWPCVSAPAPPPGSPWQCCSGSSRHKRRWSPGSGINPFPNRRTQSGLGVPGRGIAPGRASAGPWLSSAWPWEPQAVVLRREASRAERGASEHRAFSKPGAERLLPGKAQLPPSGSSRLPPGGVALRARPQAPPGVP